jgi:hypothetical protein
MVKTKRCQVLVAHTFNPSYLGGRGQEDLSKPAQANSELILFKNKRKT